tara:strand:+ start:44 stop:220 length:177 start_codon:yes stop_codon:yes gene_type:complete
MKLWEATEDQKNKSNLFKYENFLHKRYKIKFNKNYSKLLTGVLRILKNFGIQFGISQT